MLAFAANADPSGLAEGMEENPTFAASVARARGEYAALSPTPHGFDGFEAAIAAMWAGQPHWTDTNLARIRTPVVVFAGDHDEAILRAHTEHLTAAIEGSGLLILPVRGTSHSCRTRP